MQRVFSELIWQLVEVYVDDIFVKSRQIGDLVPNLAAIFEKLRKFQVRLNPRSASLGFRGVCSSALLYQNMA
jgi:hypothetical protein